MSGLMSNNKERIKGYIVATFRNPPYERKVIST